jgi:hypothetical protein
LNAAPLSLNPLSPVNGRGKSSGKAIQSVGGDDALRALQLELAKQPDKGDVIQGTGGLRKVRLKLPGAGKSGGARAIYLHLPALPCIVFVHVYAKSKKTDLSQDEKKAFRRVVENIKERQHLIP